MPELDKIEKAVEDMLAAEAVELVDMRYLQEGGRWVLRFYLDKRNGITLDDCEYFSDRIGALLDTLDAIPHSYSLEVSSPGMDRVLKREKDFARFAGHRVKVRLKAPMEGQRRFSGLLQGVEDGKVVVELGRTQLRVAPAEIDEARLDPDISV